MPSVEDEFPSWFHELVHTRRSIRHFTSQPVDRVLLERIILDAIQAPSAHNRQPWRFAVVTSQEAKNRLAEAMGKEFLKDLLADGLSPLEADARVERSRRRIQDAPVVIVLCTTLTDMDHYPDARRQELENLMAVQSTALAGGTLLLSAHAEGLSGVWVCGPLFAPQAVRCALDLPGLWHPQALLLLGYHNRIPEPPSRKPLDEVVLFIE